MVVFVVVFVVVSSRLTPSKLRFYPRSITSSPPFFPISSRFLFPNWALTAASRGLSMDREVLLAT